MKNVLFASALVIGLTGVVSANAHTEHHQRPHGGYQVTDPCCNTECHSYKEDPRAMAPASNFHGEDTGMVHTHKGPAKISKEHSKMEHPESAEKGMHKGKMMHHHKVMHHKDAMSK